MTLTRIQVEKGLVARAETRMTLVGFAVTVVGSNADLADPIATALLDMGLACVDITSPTDAEISAVENVPELLDRAELRLLQNILGNLDAVDITVGPRSERLGQIQQSLEAAIARKEKSVAERYGTAPLSTGRFVHNFASKGDDEFDE
jgi:hypothetical protein